MKAFLVLSALLFCLDSAADGVVLPDAKRVVLDNGTVLILNEKHDVPLIGLEVMVHGGAAADPAGKHGVARLLAGLLQKGAGERSAAEFAEAVAAVGGNLDASADIESVTISAEFMARDAALMVEFVSDLLQKPSLEKREFEKLRERSINLIKAAKGSDPGGLMPIYANAFLFGEHPYGNPVGGSEASLAAVTHGDVLAYYNDVLGGDRLIVAVSGAFDTADMEALLTDAFGDWRAAVAELTEIAAPAAHEGGNRVLLIDKPGATQTYFRIGDIGVSRGFARRAELDLANTVFGGRFTSMLMTELRTRSGLSYSARSAIARYGVSGSIFINSFTETSTTMAAIDLAVSILGRLRDNGLSEEQLVSARNYVMGQFPPRLETAAQLAGIFSMLERFRLDKSYIDDYGAALQGTTAESVSTVIDDVYPPAAALTFVILGDAELVRDKVAAYGPVTEISITEPRFHP